MLRPTPEQNWFLGGAVLAALPGALLFGWLAGLLLCCLVALSADRLAVWSARSFCREGYLASMVSGACIAWVTLIAGMSAVALIGALVVPYMRTEEWMWAMGMFGPFLNPVGAFMGAAFATLPSLLIGMVLGIAARRNRKRVS